MLKIFVTGDNHIGLKYASHEQSEILVQSRITAFEHMVEAADQEECDLFVITGDLFESTSGIAEKTIRTLLEILSRFSGTVVVLPGNHDYYDSQAKVWQSFKKDVSEYDNIMLLTEFRPYELFVREDRVVLYPALCTTLHSDPGKNNLDWIKQTKMTDDGAYHIGIAHGAVEGETIDREGQYFLMTRSELESIPVDLWLIGHTHVPFPRNLTDTFTPCEKILNAGTHVQTDVSCVTEGQCFVVEITEERKVLAKKFISGNLRFYRKRIQVSPGEMERILERELAEIQDLSVVDLILTGMVDQEEYEQRTQIVESALAPFVEGTYNDSGLSKQITKELIDAEFVETSFSAGLLTALLSEPKEAQLIYEMLKSMKGGK